MEGVAYRGRVMVEINMELGKLPTQRVEDVKIVDQKKLTVNIYDILIVIYSLYLAISQKTQVQAVCCILFSYHGEAC